MTERVLVVVAHPDDESLFMGARIVQMVREKMAVRVVALSDGVGSRRSGPRAQIRRADHFYKACDVLGVDGALLSVFSDQQSDLVPLLHINTQVENEVEAWRPSLVYTHHVGDLNMDHRRVAESVLVATRGRPVFSMAPEWPSRCVGPVWEPDISFDIGTAMETKVAACLCYEDEIRPYPHPRSERAIREQRLEWFKVIQ